MKLQLLTQQLKGCPALKQNITQKMLWETWSGFREMDLEHGDAITPAVMAGVILYDEESFGTLLNETERTQLHSLARKALERYLQQTNPPNKLGKLIAASLKEQL